MKASEYFGDWMDVIDTAELRKILSWISTIDKTLLVFDEVDKGFDLSHQVGMSNMYRNLHKKFNVSILAVTHTLFPILVREEIFYFEFRKIVSSELYCCMKTGYDIIAEKLGKNERKED